MPDPLSIAAGAASIAGGITSVIKTITVFVAQVREARSDLDAVKQELVILQSTLELICQDLETTREGSVPDTLLQQIGGILTGAGKVIGHIVEIVTKCDKNNLHRAGRWVLSGQRERVDIMRQSLTSHNTALSIALEMLAIGLTRRIDHRTEAMAVDIMEIKAFIRRLEVLHTGNMKVQCEENFLLQRYLEELTSYAESVQALSNSGADDRSSCDTEDDYCSHHDLDYAYQPSAQSSKTEVNVVNLESPVRKNSRQVSGDDAIPIPKLSRRNIASIKSALLQSGALVREYPPDALAVAIQTCDIVRIHALLQPGPKDGRGTVCCELPLWASTSETFSGITGDSALLHAIRKIAMLVQQPRSAAVLTKIKQHLFVVPLLMSITSKGKASAAIDELCKALADHKGEPASLTTVSTILMKKTRETSDIRRLINMLSWSVRDNAWTSRMDCSVIDYAVAARDLDLLEYLTFHPRNPEVSPENHEQWHDILHAAISSLNPHILTGVRIIYSRSSGGADIQKLNHFDILPIHLAIRSAANLDGIHDLTESDRSQVKKRLVQVFDIVRGHREYDYASRRLTAQCTYLRAIDSPPGWSEVTEEVSPRQLVSRMYIESLFMAQFLGRTTRPSFYRIFMSWF